MIPPSFDYIAPKTLSEAVPALGENENSKILAGGQRLIPLKKIGKIYSAGIFSDVTRLLRAERSVE